MITPETIQRIKDAAHIEEVVARFLSLRKRGSNYTACCPFHNEKTGSFNVNPARNIYKCFGCGKSGDSISFLMEHDHKTYPEALRYLAEMYGIEVEEEEVSEEVRARQQERDSLLKLCAFAQQRFATALGEERLRPLELTPEVARSFGLGLKEESDFATQALAQGYSKDMLVLSRLADEKMHDLLPQGLIYPVYSKDGKPVSFISKGERWNFLPPSPLFDYGRSLFGLYQAKRSMGSQDRCYLMSNFDQVLALHQAGITNAVAPCSSVLTAEQIKDIKRFTKNITLVCSSRMAERFDSSALYAAGMHLRLVVFPQGDTPLDYARAHGSAALQTLLEEREENFLLYRARLTPTLEACQALLHLVSDPIERDAYVPIIADLLAVGEEALRR